MLAEASRLGQIFFNPKKKKNCPCGFTPSHSYNLKKKKIVRGDPVRTAQVIILITPKRKRGESPLTNIISKKKPVRLRTL